MSTIELGQFWRATFVANGKKTTRIVRVSWVRGDVVGLERTNRDGSRWVRSKGNVDTTELIVADSSALKTRLVMDKHYGSLEPIDEVPADRRVGT